MKRLAHFWQWFYLGCAIVAHFTAEALTGTFLIAVLMLLLLERAGLFEEKQ